MQILHLFPHWYVFAYIKFQYKEPASAIAIVNEMLSYRDSWKTIAIYSPSLLSSEPNFYIFCSRISKK